MTKRFSMSLLFTLAFAPSAWAQAQPVEVALQVGSSKHQFSGQGQCKAAPQASIYGINAALYTVSQRAGGQALNLTLWQPKDGSPNMISLRVSSGSKAYQVDTVKGGAKRDTKGSGSATVDKAGVFTLDAVAATGEKITGRIRCGSFGGIQAEGG
jgi:hypothetical protein